MMSKTNLQIAKPAAVNQNANKAYSGISYSLQNAELPVNRIQPSKQTIIQPKLEISIPDDEYEKEAGSIADKVMRMADSSVEDEKNIQAEPIAETISPLVQTSMNGASEQSLSNSDLETRINNSKNGGSPLSEFSRTFMESSFGADFSHVKIHTDANAVQMNKELNAQAFTHGSDIYFNSGKFDPDSTSGKRLLAHELTHVIQQTGDKKQNNASHLSSLQFRRIPGRASVENGLYSLKSTCDDVVVQNTTITYSIEQTTTSIRNSDSVIHIQWSVENDSLTLEEETRSHPGYKPFYHGPQDKWEWTLTALIPGTHQIRAKVYMNETLEADLIFKQVVTKPSEGPMEITVIDDSDFVGKSAAFFRSEPIYMSNSETMVENVLEQVGARKISRLNILDHGNPKGFYLGNDWITLKTLPDYEKVLSRLRGHFTAGGIIHLQSCEVGQNHPLLIRLSKLCGVTVIAGTGLHNAVYRFNLGDYEQCDPEGSCTSDIPRP